MALATSNAILEEERPTKLEFNSPSVGILSQRLTGPGKFRVLDLGAPAKSTMEFFSSRPCTYYVEDLDRFLIQPLESRKFNDGGDDGSDDGGDGDEDFIANALGFEHSVRFDLVLGWDLFSYMQRGTIELLMKRITRSCRPGSLLFLAVATGPMISSVPARIAMVSGGRLHYETPVNGRSISNPRFSPTALESMMPGFRLLHSFLLGDQMQEFLFSYT